MGVSPVIYQPTFRKSLPPSILTGLGLALVKQIVEAHDGRVTVESQVDEGSTFTVALPLLED